VKEKMKETDLAKKVVEYLEDLQWDVYQEVQAHSYLGSACADIVAVNGPVAWVIECKVTAGLRVIEQALRWKGHANMVSIAVPNSSWMAQNVCLKYGIGVLHVRKNLLDVYEVERPHLIRKTSKRLREKLRPEHKTIPAGSANGGQWTPFKETCRNVLRSVKHRPGISMKDLLKNTSTHYASPSSGRACLIRWLDAGVVPGVEIRRDGRNISLYPKIDTQ
jgi:hypothetical protein